VNRILAIARKEFVHIRRDPRLMIAVLIMPLIQLFLFAYALSFDVKDIPTAVLDQDMTRASRDFTDAFRRSNYFELVERIDTLSEVDGVFDRGAARAVVIVPHGFGDHLAGGQRAPVAVLVDGSEPNSAQLGQAYASGLSRVFGGRLAVRWAEARGIDPSRLGGVEPHLRVWYNPEGRSAVYLVPGLIVVLIMIVTVQQTATTLVKEKDQGTLEQLIVSPVRRIELMIGKVAPWVVLAAADVVGITLAGVIVFRIPFRGDLGVFAVSSGLFVLCCLALGLLISSRASSPEVANQTALLVSFLPGFMLSGFVFPLANVPRVLRFVSYLFPARYMVIITRSAFLKGAGWPTLWPQVAALAVYAVVALTITSLVYQRRL